MPSWHTQARYNLDNKQHFTACRLQQMMLDSLLTAACLLCKCRWAGHADMLYVTTSVTCRRARSWTTCTCCSP
jgi:hypothetical protein